MSVKPIFEHLFIDSSGKCVGTIGVSDDREKSFGAPEAQISPQQPKFEPLPKRFFSPSHSKDLIYQVHLRINRMNRFLWDYVNMKGKVKEKYQQQIV